MGNCPILLTGFQLRRNQTDLVHTRIAHDVNRTRHLRENDVVITFDKGYFFGPQFENIV